MPPDQLLRSQHTRTKTQGKTAPNVFDGDVFRQTVNENISDTKIKQLQEAWGTDIGAAVDHYREPDKEVFHGNQSEAEVNKADFAPPGDQSLTLEIVGIKKLRWDLKRPSKTPKHEAKGIPCVLLVRRQYSEKMVYVSTVIDVKGLALRKAILAIFRGAEGLEMTETNVELSDIHFLFWARSELELLATHYAASGDAADKPALFEIRSALAFITQEWAHTDSLLSSLLPHSISFDLLWVVFPPECLVIGKDELGFDNIWRARTHSVVRQQDGSNNFVIVAEQLEWDGSVLGYARTRLTVPGFNGLIPMEDLPYIPLKFHSGQRALMERILVRGEKKLKFCKKGFKIQQYSGRGLRKVEKDVISFVRSRDGDLTAVHSGLLNSLVMEESLRATMYKLVKTYSLGLSDFDDFVEGKGKGLIGLLYGPPGSGKTLTAEAIAETGHMPLYMVSSGALGHEPEGVFVNLMSKLRLATHWKAVLLLDEADVFLAKRSLTGLTQNAIVSVFLRALEYYEGILLLTTNQIDKIDEAFLSRTHFCHQYSSLDFGARRQIWMNFLEKASKSEKIKINIGEDGLQQLADLAMNGRQVYFGEEQSSLRSDWQVSARTLTADGIIDVIRTLQRFQLSREEVPGSQAVEPREARSLAGPRRITTVETGYREVPEDGNELDDIS
ncbi:hypothetical protein CORC01_07186 [Colletotrichum orchidophilum]|uniref:AAA+ ATPase domain-containing protein n=1 Tax=Colletotrichum orchidophilum TaxID=1209926 RepID=A0A1G4B823_9PEZI|nr:uncharacterized protein CORC01_07186 [Colletotrichum orchidophilum]OHE97571.1 hypothetical protein CORC01_07186 [Colletotrichum orchidophilum]